MPHIVKVAHVCVVANEGRELDGAVGVGIWRRRHLPYFCLAAKSHSKMPARRREGQSRDSGSEGKMVEGDSSRDICQDSEAIFVNAE